MLETLRSKFRFTRKDTYPLGNEMLSEVWYERLPVLAQVEVATLLSRLEYLQNRTGVKFGAIAVGSTTKPDASSFNDIDIKIIIEEQRQSMQRHLSVELLRRELLAYFAKKGVGYELEDLIGEKLNPCVGASYSIKTNFPQVPLPLHIHISGEHDWAMSAVLEDERRNNRNF